MKTIAGNQIQIDRSGQGHNWQDIDADEISSSVREEIEGEIMDGNECENFVASNGQHYRWDKAYPEDQLSYGCFDGLRGLEIEMTLDQALSASHQGECDEDVAALLRVPSISAQFDAMNADDIRKGLKEAGAWDEEELADDDENRKRALWLAACDIKENQNSEA